MFDPGYQPGYLPLLHEQQRYYTAELGRTHQALSKLYKKLAKTERDLASWQESGFNRKVKKKMQWSRSVSKQSVGKLEREQADLHECLRQCNELMTFYNGPECDIPPRPYWTAYPLTPFSPVPGTPWTAGPYRPCLGEQTQERPQYWDLSMLRERRQSSPHASSADSGFYEPAMYGHPFGLSTTNDSNHRYAHEQMSPHALEFIPSPQRSKKSSLSEEDDLPEIVSPVSPTKLGADVSAPSSPRRRRYSENAISLIESRLSLPMAHQRGSSVDIAPSMKRTVSESVFAGEGSVAVDVASA